MRSHFCDDFAAPITRMSIHEYYTKPPQEGQTSRVVAVQYLLKGKKRTGPIYV